MLNDNQNHISQLDGLRFFAVTSVMFAHWIKWKLDFELIKNIPFTNGVILFFVLSGFLITKILLTNKDKYEAESKNKTSLIKSFYIRRALRILPIYYLVVFATVAINYQYARELFPWLATFTINIYQSIENISVGDFNHFWSLAVEEQFYLFWPWLILFTPRKHFLKLIIGIIVLSIAYKTYIYFFVFKWMASSYFVLSCADALAIGALVAYISLYHQGISKKLSSVFVLLPTVTLYIITRVITLCFNLSTIKNVFDEFLYAIVASIIVNRASRQEFTFIAHTILQNKFVVYCGKISYGMYLYHLFIPFVYFYVQSKTGLHIDNLFLYFLSLYFTTFVLSHFSWILIEKPINNLKNKFPYFK